MSSRWMSRAAALVSLACCGMAAADGTLSLAAEQLRTLYPGTQFAWEGTQIRAIYGAPMTMGMTPEQAATQWVSQHQQAFGAGVLELSAEPAITVNDGRFTVYAFGQSIQGMPVEYGDLRVVVLNQPVPRVVYAGGRIAAAPAGGFPDSAVPGSAAVAGVRALAQYRDLVNWTTPQAVVFQGEGDWAAPVRTWKFMGTGKASTRAFTFFVDMATGLLVHARSEIYHEDVTGTLKGMATPGRQADHAGNPPTLQDIPEVLVSVAGGNSAHTDVNGNFTIPNAGTAPVTVNSNASGGRWVNVNPQVGVEVSVSLPGQVPGTPVNAVFNAPPTALSTAQVNVLIHTDKTHNYITDRAPGFGALVPLQGNTGVSGSCNAFYSSGSQSINFYNLGGGCNNTAFSTVIAHEYGHYAVNRRSGLSQGAFGEGFGDTLSIMIYDTGLMGEFFSTGGGLVRNLITSTRTYPCSGEVHDCGEVLGAFWYRAKENFKAKYGAGPGLDKVRNLQVAWYLVTSGGTTAQGSLLPANAIEILTLNDNDGNLANGTPDYTELCQAFQTRNIQCPAISLLAFSYPNGRPATLTPGLPTTIRVDVAGVSATPVPNSGTMTFKINNGSFQTLPMMEIAPNQYEAVIPGQTCLDTVSYYFTVQSSAGAAIDPQGAPASSTFSAISAASVSVALNDDFETNLGWSAVAPGDNATTGRWNRMDPQATAAQPGDDVTAAPGVNCWVTDGNAGGGVGDFDIDNGTTTLTSPVLDMSSMPEGKISYWRWYSNTQGSAANADTFVIDITSDGTNWVNVERIGTGGLPQNNGGWFFKEFRVADLVTPSANVRVRFVASDLGAGSIVEAAVDDFKSQQLNCGVACYPDCNGDGTLNLSDFGCFTTKFATGDPYADCNGDGVRNLSDFGCFTTKFAVGCP